VALTPIRPLRLDQNVAVLNLHWIYSDFHGGILNRFTGPRVPLPSVPGADDFVPCNDALSQGPAAVQAHIVHSTNDSVDIRHADHFIAAGEFFRLPGGWEF